MGNYFDTFKKEDCNGCGVCALRCPTDAIIMSKDNEWFLYPVIDEEKCIHCGLCKRICPNKEQKPINNEETFIAYSKVSDDKKRSASGGMFFPIAKYILNMNGVVFGVAYDSDLNAIHDYAENIEDAKKFQGSKYVKSDLNDSYKKVEYFLQQGRYVLFTGTPCQCQGLRTYLKGENENLVTCEIVCHANPSPKVFKYYIKNLEINHRKKVGNIHFRSKENGWRNQTPIIEFSDGTKIEENTYFKAFVSEMINRPSCYSCHFSSEMRYSDFTIADFWGHQKVCPEINDDDSGLSLLNVNTQKAKNIFEEINKEMFYKKVDTTLAFANNHHSNVVVHKNRDKFFREISSGKINESNIIKYMNKYTRTPLYRRAVRKIKRTLIKTLKK